MTSQPPDAVVSVLTEQYGLVAPDLTPTDQGSINDTYRVSAGGESYFLKRCRPGLQRQQVERIGTVQMWLNQAGLPVPPVIANRRGELQTDCGETWCVLMPWLAGRAYQRGEISLPAARSMGTTLAALQAQLAQLTPVVAYAVPCPEAALSRLHELLLAAEQRKAPVDVAAAHLLRHRLTMVERLSQWVPSFADLKPQWVHGDYQETNLLFDEHDHVCGVLDLDNLRCRPRGLETMRALSLCFPPLADEGLAFFRAYALVAQPPPDEVRLYAALGAYAHSIGTWPLAARYFEPASYQQRWDRFIIAPGGSGWWDADLDRLTNALLAQLAP